MVPAGSHTSTARRTPSGIGTYSDRSLGNAGPARRPAGPGELAAAIIANVAAAATMIASEVRAERNITTSQVTGE